MPQIVEHLEIEQGSDYRHEWPVQRDGVARNLAGWRAVGEVRQHDRGPVLYTLPLTTGPGKVLLAVPGADSAGWRWRRARYEVKLYGPDGQQERHATGEIVVDPQLVRREAP